MKKEQQTSPKGELAIRVLAMPADTNPSGDIFGGWVMSQMDIAGGVTAETHSGGRVATVAVEGFTFHLPVYVGDVVCFYANVLKVGTTSITVHIEARVLRRDTSSERLLVTEGTFVYVALDKLGKKRSISK